MSVKFTLTESCTVGGEGTFCPTPVRGSHKYGKKGGCAGELLAELELPESTAKTLAELGNMGIAVSTWSTYRTAKTMIQKCEADTLEDMSIPFNQRKILIFIDWLIRVRKVKASTVNSYLAGIRQVHVVTGLEPLYLRSSLVKLVLKGIENRDGIHKRQNKYVGRLPMTMNMMLVFKNTIVNSEFSKHDKKLLWAVATVAFAGAIRIGEIFIKT